MVFLDKQLFSSSIVAVCIFCISCSHIKRVLVCEILQEVKFHKTYFCNKIKHMNELHVVFIELSGTVNSEKERVHDRVHPQNYTVTNMEREVVRCTSTIDQAFIAQIKPQFVQLGQHHSQILSVISAKPAFSSVCKSLSGPHCSDNPVSHLQLNNKQI